MTSTAQTAETVSSVGIILPEFNEFAIQFGNFGIRWYALAYSWPADWFLPVETRSPQA